MLLTNKARPHQRGKNWASMYDETQALSDLEPNTPSNFTSNHLEMACIGEKRHLKMLLGSTLILPEMHIGQTWNKG